MEYKKIYKNKNDLFEGYLLVKVPSYVERMDNLKELNFEIDNEGNVQINSNTYESLKKMSQVAEKHLISMEIKHKKSEKVFIKLKELEYYNEYQNIVSDIVNIVLQGVSLGN